MSRDTNEEQLLPPSKVVQQSTAERAARASAQDQQQRLESSSQVIRTASSTSTTPGISVNPTTPIVMRPKSKQQHSSSDHLRTMTPTSTKGYEDTDVSVLGESMMSLGVDFEEDPVPPPELTRPEPLRSNNSAWSATHDRMSPTRRAKPVSLSSIMNEQQQQQRHSVADDLAFLDGMIELTPEDQAAQEEALIRIALERSLRSLNENKSSHSHRSSGHGSCRSFAERGVDFVREIQMEADRIEQPIVDSPHMHAAAATLPSVSSARPSLNRAPTPRGGTDEAEMSYYAGRTISRSNSGRSHSSNSSVSPGRGYSRSTCTSPASHLASTPRQGGLSRQLSGRRGNLRRSSSHSASTLIQSHHNPNNPHNAVAVSSSAPPSAAASPHTPRSRSSGPRRQASIRIGPLPGNVLIGEDGLIDGAEAVLEVARKNLSSAEVEMIERALRKRGSTHPTKPSTSPSDIPTTPSPSSKRSTRRIRSLGSANLEESRHSTSEASTSFSDDLGGLQSHHLSQEELDQIEEALCEVDGVPPASPHPSRQRFIDNGDLDRKSPATLKDPAQLVSPTTTTVTSSSTSPRDVSSLPEEYDLRGAEANLTEEELRQIHQALLETDEGNDVNPSSSDDMAAITPGVVAAAVAAAATSATADQAIISDEDAAAIARALHEAEAEEEIRNFRLALQMQQEEDERVRQTALAATRRQQGNVRTMTRAEVEAEHRVGAFQSRGPPLVHHPMDPEVGAVTTAPAAAGFRMNSNARQEWVRRDQNLVMGPNDEVRTKHDTTLDGLANAHRLGLDEDEYGSMAHVSNSAYNSFLQSVRRNKKGVAAHGTGRAGSDTDATKGGAMDAGVRLQITRAINNGYIERCNGVVKEGKEAIVYHADKGEESGGYDVAVKVFKRIQDFKGRADYVDGDPRYANENFRRISGREQLELWTEKEFRNLTRAIRAGVPVPTPLFHKENILFMRFLGTDCWPAPQLREINMRVGSKKWDVLYSQVMDSIRKLYQKGRLVHGDLSEYNIMVVPASFVDNVSPGIENPYDELQAVLIDFGQAVDTRHPDAVILLQKDLDRVKSFFARHGVDTMGVEEALTYVVEE